MTENTFYYNKNINDGLPFIPEVINMYDVNTKPLPKYIDYNISKVEEEIIIISRLNMYDVNTKPLPGSLFVINSNKTEFPIIFTLSNYKPLEEKLPKYLFGREVNISISFSDNKYDSIFVPIVCKDTPNFSYKYTGSFEGTNINEISIPKSVKTIGRKAFNKCNNLKEIEIIENCNYEESSFSDNIVIKYIK